MAEKLTTNPKELVKLLIEKRNALQVFRLGNAGSKTKNVKAGREIRKEIARIMTNLTAAAKEAKASAPAEVKAAKPRATRVSRKVKAATK